MQLLTPRLRLDALRSADAAALFAIRADPLVSRFQGWRPVDRGEVEAFIATQNALAADATDGWMQRAIRRRDSGKLIGDMGLCLPSWFEDSVEFGITIAPDARGNGFAGEALRALFEHVFKGFGRHRIHASVDPRNGPSVALLRSLGMRQEAHHVQSLFLHGEWVDDMIFAMLAQEWQRDPSTG